MNFVGIDCGVSGAIAVINDLDETEVSMTKLSNTERDIWAELNNLDSFESFAIIERICGMPKSGKFQMTKLATSYGFMRGLLVASEIAFEEYLPSQWQKEMRCLTKGDKNVSKARAQQLFPHIKVTHWNADALLLASFGQRLYRQRMGVYVVQ